MDENIPADAETRPRLTVDQLPEKLGFTESGEILEVKALLIDAMRREDLDSIVSLKSRYLELGQKTVEEQVGEAFPRAQVGLIIAAGLIYRAGGIMDRFEEEMDDAYTYAAHMEYDDVLEAIAKAGAAEVIQAESDAYEQASSGSPSMEEIISACQGLLPDEDMEFLREMDDIEEAEGYLMGVLPERGIESMDVLLSRNRLIEHVQTDFESEVGRNAKYLADADGNPIERIRASEYIDLRLMSFEEMKNPAWFDAVAAATGISPAVAEDWRRRLAADEMSMNVAYDGKVPIGRVNVRWTGTNTDAVRSEIGLVPTVNALYVNEEHRGIGVGIRLMLACEYAVRERKEGPQVLALGVEPDNELARKLYERLDYEYRQVAGQDTFMTTWPNPQSEGAATFTAPCLLMVKEIPPETVR